MWLVALVVSCCDPSLGRFVTSLDAWMDEDFTDNIPRSSIVTTITLEGHLTLQHLKDLFTTNVLQATLSDDRRKLRYPELQQYLTRFMGFRVWKKDPHFDIENHINQKSHQGPLDTTAIHHEMMNKMYYGTRSPWEVVLIHSVSSTGVPQSVIAARLHHTMADGKSILKMLVECLGQKRLKTANALPQKPDLLKTFVFYAMFPLSLVRKMTYLSFKFCTSRTHPWNLQGFRNGKDTRISVTFSPKLLLTDVKQVAKKNKVTSSSVVMSIVAGAIRKCGVEFEDRDIIMGYPLPKDNHPESMANHVYMGIIPLPTDQGLIYERLHKCNDIFLDAKGSQLGKYTAVTALQSGTLIYPLAKRLALNHFLPVFITNIAGDEEGFQVGNLQCSDFRMSVGTLEGVGSVTFCAFSYKDGIYVGITAKESVMPEEKTKKLAEDIASELNLLTTDYNCN